MAKHNWSMKVMLTLSGPINSSKICAADDAMTQYFICIHACIHLGAKNNNHKTSEHARIVKPSCMTVHDYAMCWSICKAPYKQLLNYYFSLLPCTLRRREGRCLSLFCQKQFMAFKLQLSRRKKKHCFSQRRD